MPRLRLTFREFVRIIEDHGFLLVRQEGSHKHYRRTNGVEVHFVTVAGHRETDVIISKTLASMIRQSGLPKNTFKK